MNCLFSQFHSEGTLAVEYRAAKIMDVPLINFEALHGKCVGVCGWHPDGAGGGATSIYCTNVHVPRSPESN